MTGKTKDECRKKLAAAKQAPRQAQSRETVAAYLTRWMAHIKPTLRGSTIHTYEKCIRLYIEPGIGRLRLGKLDASDIAALESEMVAAGHSTATVRLVHGIIAAALKQAVAWRLIERNEARLVKQPKLPDDPMRALTPPETTRVFAAADRTPLAALWRLAASCGLRRGELLGLQWQDIDFERGTLSVQRQVTRHGNQWVIAPPKTDRSRRLVALSASTLAALRAHRAAQNKDRLKAGALWAAEDWVFCDALGRRLGISALEGAHERLEKAAAVEHFRLHDLRHTGATLALVAGVHPKVVQEMLGHKSVAMTLDRYSHVAESMQKEAAEAIEALLERAKDASDKAAADGA
ncbi:MAG TPA: tyrosine-type recombinase/integrase [Thermomicrobiales bacterium]|nr:tyrosine-type recombinase/integrase [Thermomicrobiales bacterium]